MIGTILSTWVAATLTIAIFSFLYKDNPLYKFAEHLYVGISAAFLVVYVWAFDVKPMLWDAFMENLAKKNYAEAYILIIPAMFGGMMLLRWFGPKIGWLSRWPIAFTVGIGAGLGIIGSIQGFLIPQIKGTLVPLITENILITINNIILFVGVITSILYFYFSAEHKGWLRVGSRVGIIFLMIAFGASFGYTVMARISLLIGRLYFLIYDWITPMLELF